MYLSGGTERPKVKKKRESFPFMRLPPEVRNRIYEMALVNTTAILPGIDEVYFVGTCRHLSLAYLCEQCGYSSEQDYMQALIIKRTATSLKLVSRQVSQESSAVFFRKNEFKFHARYYIKTFLTGISAIERQLLTRLKLFMSFAGYGVRDVNLLRKCTGLKSLDIYYEGPCGHSEFSGKSLSQYYVESNFPTFKAFLKLRGIVEVSIRTRCKRGLPSDRDCHALTEFEAFIREHITKPRSEASIRAQIVHDTPELWKELKAEKEKTKAVARKCRKRKRKDEQ